MNVAEYSAARMRKAAARAPMESKWGDWTVISRPFRAAGKTGLIVTYIMVRCSCDTERRVTLSSLVRGHTKRCHLCGVRAAVYPSRKRHENANYKGDNHRRDPFEYRDRLYEERGDVCAWPPCGKPLSGRIAVDHRHDRCCPGDKTCWHCVRGAVHHRCNVVEIAGVECAIKLGAIMPPDIEAYLNCSNRISSMEAA